MPLMAHHAPASWSTSIPLAVVILVIAILYLRGLSQPTSGSRIKVPFYRPASFLFGLALIGLALSDPLAHLDHQFLTAHMVQHLLLMN